MTEPIVAFPYFGGKNRPRVLRWILSLLPPCRHYVEPFGGSAAVLLNRPPSPVETYNDIDGEVVNFFRVLRDRPDELIRAIALTPYARAEYYEACHEPAGDMDPVERARRFYVRIRQAFGGVVEHESGWSYGKSYNHALRWLSGIDDLPKVASRLLRVQIERRPAIQVIQEYDTPETLFYCDPPYVLAARRDPAPRGYRFEMGEEEHRQLAVVLNAVRGRVAISGYDCDLMDELYPPEKWRKVPGPAMPCGAGRSKRKFAQEYIWLNYDPVVDVAPLWCKEV